MNFSVDKLLSFFKKSASIFPHRIYINGEGFVIMSQGIIEDRCMYPLCYEDRIVATLEWKYNKLAPYYQPYDDKMQPPVGWYSIYFSDRFKTGEYSRFIIEPISRLYAIQGQIGFFRRRRIGTV